MKTRNKFILLAIGAVLLAVFISTGKVLGLASKFAPAEVTLAGRSFHVRPASELHRVGSRFGLPLFEMQDELLLIISYDCVSSGEIEVIKDGKDAHAPAKPYVSGGRCYRTFRAPFAMTGIVTLRLTSDGKTHVANIHLKRRISILSPILEMYKSV
jgi:hypothetical protein